MIQIPQITKETIDRYVEHGVPMGDFCTAVMANDLIGAFSRADYNNTHYMREIVAYVYSSTPVNCHGSYEIVENWIENKRLERETKDA